MKETITFIITLLTIPLLFMSYKKEVILIFVNFYLSVFFSNKIISMSKLFDDNVKIQDNIVYSILLVVLFFFTFQLMPIVITKRINKTKLSNYINKESESIKKGIKIGKYLRLNLLFNSKNAIRDKETILSHLKVFYSLIYAVIALFLLFISGEYSNLVYLITLFIIFLAFLISTVFAISSTIEYLCYEIEENYDLD